MHSRGAALVFCPSDGWCVVISPDKSMQWLLSWRSIVQLIYLIWNALWIKLIMFCRMFWTKNTSHQKCILRQIGSYYAPKAEWSSVRNLFIIGAITYRCDAWMVIGDFKIFTSENICSAFNVLVEPQSII